MKRSTGVGLLVAAILLLLGIWCAPAAAFPPATPQPAPGGPGGQGRRPGFAQGRHLAHPRGHHGRHHGQGRRR